MTAGTLYGVGIGPGDPELITLKGLRLLQRVRHVFLPATAPERSYAGTIAAQHIDPSRHEVVYLVCPPYRDRSQLLSRWAELSDEVAATVRRGEDAIFLTEGDPSLYSTFQYLATAFAERHPDLSVVTVPGVSSVTAAAAAAGVPLGMWNQRIAIVPATAATDEISASVRSFDTTVLLKPGDRLAELNLTEDSAEIVLVRRAGRPDQAIVRGEAALREAGKDYFSLLIVRRKHQ